MIKVSALQEDITVFNVCDPNNRAKTVKQKPVELQEETDNPLLRTRNFITFLSVINKHSHQKQNKK